MDNVLSEAIARHLYEFLEGAGSWDNATPREREPWLREGVNMAEKLHRDGWRWTAPKRP